MVALPVPPSTTCNPEFEVAIYRYFCNITTAPHLRIWMYRFKWLTSEVNLYTAHYKRSQYCAAVSKALNKWVFNRRLNSEFCVWSSERRKVAGKLLKYVVDGLQWKRDLCSCSLEVDPSSYWQPMVLCQHCSDVILSSCRGTSRAAAFCTDCTHRSWRSVAP